MNTYHKIQSLYKRYTHDHPQKGKFIIGQYSKSEFELLKDIQWIWTEKIDGTNIRVCWYYKPLLQELEFRGKTDKADIPKHLIDKLKQTFFTERFVKVFEVDEEGIPDICLYGEGYGYKIQSGGKYMNNPDDVDFILFDIKIGNLWLKREDVEEIADKLLIDVVPKIGKGTINEAIEYIKSAPKSTFGYKDFVMEGLVLKPEVELRDRMGRRIITKIKYKDFAEKN